MARAPLLGLGVSVAAVGAAYLSAFAAGGPPGWAPWAMVGGTAGALVSAMALGASRGGSVGRLKLPFAFVFVVLTGGFGLVLALPAADPGDPSLWLGLPPRTAVVMYGIGLLPLLAIPLAYALTFDELTLSAADWERIRRAAAGSTGERPAADAGGAGEDRE